MPAYAVIGAQWGDEGKGKVVDFLARNVHMIARYSGGNNAGHTVINDLGKFKFHVIPSGILWPDVTCVIGNGVVVDPDMFLQEVRGLESQGIDTKRLHISNRAHVIMPYHTLLDHLEEQARGADALGTTGKGVGPAYMDKAARIGIRMEELLDQKALRSSLETALAHKAAIIAKVYNAEAPSIAEMVETCRAWGEQLSPYISSTEVMAQQALKKNEKILLEGAQGTLLDIDHGTYPFVTSSSPSIGGTFTGLGIQPTAMKAIAGVFKAYCTRVGSGPLPTEIDSGAGEEIRERAWEYGTTTGRPRRVGWFDGVLARYSAIINGFTSVVLTRLDVLDGFSPVKICVAYRLNGKVIDQFPASAAMLQKCEPIYEDLPGWDQPTASIQNFADLPNRAVQYVKRLEEIIGCPVDLISTGPKREETVSIRPIIE